MKLETLKKNKSKKILIGGVIVFVLISVITFTTTRAKYKSIQNLKLADGTIKYTSSDLKLIAMYQANEDGTYNNITSVPSSGYILNTENSSCKVNGIKDTSIKIEYINGKINIANLTKKGTNCYLYFDKKPLTSETIIAAIQKSSEYHATGNPTFSNVSSGNEGIYTMADGMYGGTSYYWRGAATTNHVIFADKCWRIVRINGDGTIRLIYNGRVLDENTCFGNEVNADSVIIGATDAEKYYATSDGQKNNSSYVGWTYTLGEQRPTTNVKDSNAKTQTEKWYSENITGTNANKVADGYFCNDRNVSLPPSVFNWGTSYTTTWNADEKKFAYAPANRLAESYEPTLSCPDGDKYTLKVGAITANEIVMAGGKFETANNKYYLYTGKGYWTMSPDRWSGASADVFAMANYGDFGHSSVSSTYGLRPVINLKFTTVFVTGGNGTADNPYVVQ